ncbi:MAG: NAD(P)H-hydrate epimerase, partial [Candidatus Hodarchaeales archaeon]
MLLLPGISKKHMVEVDRIMMDELLTPVELMMEHAGLNLARLAVRLGERNVKFQVICGTGNNGGGGLVAARRLFSWGSYVEVFLPKREDSLRQTPREQLERVRRLGVSIYEGIPTLQENKPNHNIILDCFIGYGYQSRDDKITKSVFEFFKTNEERVIALDAPSGLDVNTG